MLRAFHSKRGRQILDPLNQWRKNFLRNWKNTIGNYGYILIFFAISIFLMIDTSDDRRRLQGLAGIAFFLISMYALSTDRTKINWRPVILGFTVQFLMALLVLRWNWGAARFADLARLVVKFLDYTKKGTEFVFGFLASPPNICGMMPVFVFSVLQTLIYFAALVAVLYYYGIIQFILKQVAMLVRATLTTTAAESLQACACVFLGMTEGPLLIQPYIEKMTASELHAVLTSNFSCIAGTLFAAYISLGACPSYLLSSSIMSAPGSLACSKLLFPETEESHLKNVKDLDLPRGNETTALECLSNSASATVSIVFSIGANLLVVIAFLAFFDDLIGYLGELVGIYGLSFQILLGYLFFPLAYLMGVTELEETLRVAQLMGTKTALNEFIAYQKLGELTTNNLLKPKAAMIATYALCGFSNFSAVGMQLEFLGKLAPNKKDTLSRIVMRALLAGSISCFFTASIAGILVHEPVQCLPASANRHCFNPEKFLNLTTPYFDPNVT